MMVLALSSWFPNTRSELNGIPIDRRVLCENGIMMNDGSYGHTVDASEILNNHLECIKTDVVNNGIHSQPQSVRDF